MNTIGRVAILRCGPDVLRRLDAAPREAGLVQSVFERAINLTWHDGRLLTFHGPGRLLAPFAAELSRLRGIGAPPGARVWRREHVLTLDGVMLDWRAAAIADTRMPESASDVRSVLSVLLGGGLGPAAPALSSVAAVQARSLIAEGLGRHLPALFIEGARQLIGLGEGLTPAGDDCVVGVLAVIHRLEPSWLRQHPKIAHAIAARAAEATTTLAGEFVAHALDGRFAETVIDLLTGRTADAVECAAARLLRTGATSGADTLAGVRLALGAVLHAKGGWPSGPPRW